MKQVWQKFFLMTFPLATLGSFAPLTSVKAQITPDNSLGAESSVVNRNTMIRGVTSDRIDGGARRGGNLFHSFQEFNVGAQRGAYFSNPTGVDNILTRVTGGNPSNISGKLGVLGNANLFLINPHGIVFGQNASLDVRGSFFASTASSLIFNNGFEFSTTNPQAPPLLTVNIPIGLRFRDNPGDLTVRGFGHQGFDQNGNLVGASNSFQNPTLVVDAGKTLALVGGNVTLNGGVLQAPGGLVELGGLTAPGTVGINSNNSLSFPDAVARGDVTLTNQAGINVITNALSGGSININARNIGISGQSLLTAGIAGGLGEVNYQAGDIRLNATGETRIDQSRIENNVNASTSANNRNIDIVTGSFFLTNGARLDVSNLGSFEREAGNVRVNAKGQLTIDREASIISNGFFGRVFLTSSNNSVNLSNSLIRATSNNSNNNDPSQFSLIQITAPTSSIYIDNSTLSTTNSSTGFAGDININARDLVSITSPDPFSARGNDRTIQSNGNRGRILIGSETSSPKMVELKGVSLSATNDSIPDTVTDRINAGDVSIYAQDKIFLDQSFIETLSRRPGNAGNVTLQTNNGDIELAGNAGIFRDKTAGSTIYSNIEPGGQGNTGIIQINTGNLTLKQGSQLQNLVSNGAQVDAGSSPGIINIQASGNVLFSGTGEVALSTGALGPFSSGVRSEVQSEFSRNAGNINIQARSIFLRDSAQINSSNNSNGLAGNVTLNALDQVSLNQGTISSEGRFGRIFIGRANANGIISSPKVVSINGSTLSTTNSSIAGNTDTPINAGDISIAASDRIDINQSFVQAFTSRRGNAGSVTLRADNGDILLGDSVILNTVEVGGIGDAGGINVTARNLSLSNGAQLESSVRGASSDGKPAGQGNAGNINIQASGDVRFSGSTNISLAGTPGFFPSGVRSDVLSGFSGNAGDIGIQARSIFLTDGAQITTSNNTNGLAGNVTLNALDQVSLNQGTISSEGRFGRIFIGRANANGIIYSPKQVSINGSTLSTTNSSIVGSPDTPINAGDISIAASDRIFFANKSTINASTTRYGNAGNVTLLAENGDIQLAGAGTDVRSLVETSGIGKGGNINVRARNLSLTGGAELVEQTFGNGDAGKIDVNTTDSIFLSGVAPFPTLDDGSPGGFSSGLINTTEPGAMGRGGEINLTTSKLQISDGAVLNARSRSHLTGGDITVNTNTLEITGGGQIFTTSFSDGNAGSITVNVNDRINISGSDRSYRDRFNSVANAFPQGFNTIPNGEAVARSIIDPVSSESGIFANITSSESRGNGGNITIKPRLNQSSGTRFPNVTIANGAQVSVDNQGQGTGGNIDIQGNIFTLDQGRISATTASADGGNINLNLQNSLRLRRESEISASSRSQNSGSGGNININTPFIISFPSNNDITANAFNGRGGNININRDAILYGINPLSREELERLLNTREPSQLDPRKVPTSDITAISQQNPSLNGTLNINTSYLDPSQSLVKLPENVVDPTTQIAQNPCQHGAGSSLAITGRGGIPSNPNQTLASDNVRVGLVTPALNRGTAKITAILPSTKPTVKKAVPVQGWIFNDKGQVVLTAYDPTKTGSQRPWRTPASCAKR